MRGRSAGAPTVYGDKFPYASEPNFQTVCREARAAATAERRRLWRAYRIAVRSRSHRTTGPVRKNARSKAFCGRLLTPAVTELPILPIPRRLPDFRPVLVIVSTRFCESTEGTM